MEDRARCVAGAAKRAAESFVKIFKRNYVYVDELPDTASVMRRRSAWFENDRHVTRNHLAVPREAMAGRLVVQGFLPGEKTIKDAHAITVPAPESGFHED